MMAPVAKMLIGPASPDAEVFLAPLTLMYELAWKLAIGPVLVPATSELAANPSAPSAQQWRWLAQSMSSRPD